MSLLQASNVGKPSTTTYASNQVSSFHSVGLQSTVNTSNISTSLYLVNNLTFGSWIIYSGASDHIYSSLHWFHSYYDINMVNIRLPNGNFAVAKQLGTIYFTSQFFIQNILFVPQLSLNLISVSKLCQDLNCTINFTNSQCLIQEPQSLKMIGYANFIEGLYHLNLSNKIMHTAVATFVSKFIIKPKLDNVTPRF